MKSVVTRRAALLAAIGVVVPFARKGNDVTLQE